MTKRTKRFFAAAAVVSVLCGGVMAQPAGSPVAKHGTLKVEGNRIVNKDGDPVALRGMSFFWNTTGGGWNDGSDYYTSGVTNWLASDWKVDVVRVAINPGSRSLSNWKTVVDAAIAKGLYVIIDWHSHTAYNETNDAKGFFETQADAYKSTPNVLFEIFNEPDTKESPCTWAQVKSYANTIVSAIRLKSANNIIIIGSRDYSKKVDEATADPVTGTNLAYSVHYYTAEPGTEHQSTLRGMATTALNRGYALFATEWGLSEADGGQNNRTKIDTDEANRWFEFLDKNSIGWANWSICRKDEAASALKSSASTSGNWGSGDLSPSGTFVRNALIAYTNTYTVTVTKTGNGTVTGGGSHPRGTMVTLTATADPGWAFEKWEGTDGVALGTMNPATFAGPLYSSKSVTAVFGEGSMIRNGTFTTSISEWNSNSTGVTLAQEDGTLKVTVTSASAAVRQFNLNLQKGKKYAFSFRAKASTGNVSVVPRFTNRTGGATYWEGAPVALTSAWATTSREFNMCSETDAETRFWLSTDNVSGAAYYVDDIKLDEAGAAAAGACQSLSALPSAAAGARRASLSVSRVGGALQLRGPVEAGARVSLYDVRGKVVRSMAASDGLAFGAGIPAGSYFVVVRGRAGGEVLRTKAVLAK